MCVGKNDRSHCSISGSWCDRCSFIFGLIRMLSAIDFDKEMGCPADVNLEICTSKLTEMECSQDF